MKSYFILKYYYYGIYSLLSALSSSVLFRFDDRSGCVRACMHCLMYGCTYSPQVPVPESLHACYLTCIGVNHISRFFGSLWGSDCCFLFFSHAPPLQPRTDYLCLSCFPVFPAGYVALYRSLSGVGTDYLGT